MRFIKKWQKIIASVLTFAMLASNFGSFAPIINATDVENSVASEQLPIDTVLDDIVDESVSVETEDQINGVTDATLGEETEIPKVDLDGAGDIVTLTIHYNRDKADYEGWGIHVWYDGHDGKGYDFTHKDNFGYLLELEVPNGTVVNYIIRDKAWNKNFTSETNPNGDQSVEVNSDTEIWVGQGQDGFDREAPGGLTGDRVELPKPEVPDTAQLTIHYNRLNADYAGWNLYSWFNGESSIPFQDEENFGAKVNITVPVDQEIEYIIRKSTSDNAWADKNHNENQKIKISQDTEVWVYQGQNGYFTVAAEEMPTDLYIHYTRTDDAYEGRMAWVWGLEGVTDYQLLLTQADEFGVHGKISVNRLDDLSDFGFKFNKDNWGEQESFDRKLDISKLKKIVKDGRLEVHIYTLADEKETFYEPQVDNTPIDLIVHYERPGKDYDGFKLYSWGAGDDHRPFNHTDGYGRVGSFSFERFEDVKNLGFIVYQEVEGAEWWANKDGGDKKNIDLKQLQIINNVDKYVAHIYIKQGSDEILYSNPYKEDYSTVTVHYMRPENDYAGWNMWVWGTGSDANDQVSFEYKDEHSYIAEFKVKTGNELGYIIRKGNWEEKNFDGDQKLKVYGNTEIWVNVGQNGFDAIGPVGTREELPEEFYVDKVSDEEAEVQLFIHYYRYLEDYRSWNVWGWVPGHDLFGKGNPYSFIETDDFGKVAKINLKDLKETDQLGFMIRKGEWSAKDIDKDRFVDLTKAVRAAKETKSQVHVYVLQDDVTIYLTPEIDKTAPLKKATFTSSTQFSFNSAKEFEDTEGVTVRGLDGKTLEIESLSLSKNNMSIDVKLKTPIEVGDTYFVSKEGYRGELYIEFYGLFDSKEFANKFTYTGNDLGATYAKKETKFRVWAPTASEVKLRLYQDGHTDSLLKEVDMTKDVNGTWITTVKGDQNKVYYTYVVTVGHNTEEAVDPYARAVGVNGQRAMVVSLDSTNPSGWGNDQSPPFSGNVTDAVLYELHMRDLSTHASSGIKNVGKYLQFTEEGTVSDKGVATGLDHIKEMGITHLHLLPSFDHRSIDETKLDVPQFNWGYDPQHYNVPEGSYSTDPYNGEVRINEFKQMVSSLHDNGIRVVMDVVYNHTGATSDSDFNKIVPGYYYRQDDKGDFANGSGCGNETASERLMMRKFMIDSVVYWAQEYNIDGFRFDLMALHDVETMNQIEAALKAINPTIIIYGEGWTGGGTPLPNTEAAYKGNAKQTPNIAFFNDDMRDAIKGKVANDWEPGFINGDTSNYFYERLQFGIVGSIKHDQVDGWSDWAANPSQSISYVSAHDNNTLYDKLLGVEKEKGEAGNTSMAYIKKLQKQANAIVLMGQGVPFLHAGVEMMRTKGGNHNSYNAPDEVNQINWDWKYENYDVVQYYKGLIELRKAHPAFRMMEQADVQTNLRFDETTSKNIMSYTISDYANGDSVSDIAVLHNVSNTVETGYLPIEGTWSMVVNGEKAGTKVIEVIEGNTFEMQPHSSYVLMLNYNAPETNEDTEAPIITLVGKSQVEVELGNEYKELGAFAFDKEDGIVEVVMTGEVDANKVGTYIITYTAMDKAGNKSSRERRVSVVTKLTPPTPEPENPGNNNSGNNNSTNNSVPNINTNKPSTGLTGIVMYVGIGLFLITLGGMGFYLDRKRKYTK